MPLQQWLGAPVGPLSPFPRLRRVTSTAEDLRAVRPGRQLLAFIAVLPEYAVVVVFSWKAGHGVANYGSGCRPPGSTDASPCSLALANMTGSNRLLIGIGWSLVVFLAWWQWRKRGRRDAGITLDRSHSVELAFLAIATLYSLTLPLRRTVTLLDAGILVAIFA